MTLVRWDKIMASKSKGGLGVSSLYASNRALLFKWIWRLHSNCTSIWAKLYKLIPGEKEESLTLIRENKRLYWRNWYIDDMILPQEDFLLVGLELTPLRSIFLLEDKLDWFPNQILLASRGLEIESLLCPTCNVSAETSSHTFFACSLARNIMHNICYWWELDLVSLNSYSDWIIGSHRTAKTRNKKRSSKAMSLFLVVIWNFRNQTIFAKVCPKKEFIFDNIVQSSFFGFKCCIVKFDWVSWLKNPNLLSL
ncbi:hypothetical protein Tco_0099951 [Tanacetum coccineum]